MRQEKCDSLSKKLIRFTVEKVAIKKAKSNCAGFMFEIQKPKNFANDK